MSIHVLFFGATADLVEAREMEFPVNNARTATDVLEHLIADHPRLKEQRLLFAINEEYVAAETSLKDGDKLAIFTAVSGG